ncbi:MAG: multicopper oxidase family protein [Polyangiaceae bacterium]|nr:multicopper oxidase family protein [Polyangiaceae bacterium]
MTRTHTQSVLLGLVASAIGCSSPSEAPGQPDGWNASVRLQSARDKNADPHIFEADLTARVGSVEIIAGKPTPAWTYDGVLPGPFFRVTAGDKLIVHFQNDLPAPTTIHWHGLRIPAAMDGAPGHSQPEIMPGTSFEYEFVLPDPGLYWYHPHVDSAVQVGFGLYGAILVDDPNEPEDLGDELILVLSDIAVDEEGALEKPDSGGDFGTLFGREGNVLLVNGRRNPIIEARAGRRQRWRIVNAAKSRYYQLAMTDHSFMRIGGDGGRIESPIESSMLVLTPGERADVLVVPRGAPGTTLPVRWVPYDRGYGTTFNRPEEELFRIRFANEPAVTPEPLPKLSRTITPIDASAATNISLDLTQNDQNGQLAMGINGIPSWESTPITAKVGETQLFVVKNSMDFAHPFHLHGFFFQALDESGAPVHPMEWKDTIDVPVHSTKRFVVTYDNRPGMWMFHCHILDHADAGMMGMLHVEHDHMP